MTANPAHLRATHAFLSTVLFGALALYTAPATAPDVRDRPDSRTGSAPAPQTAGSPALTRGGWRNRWFRYRDAFPYLVGMDLQEIVADTRVDYRRTIDLLATYDINKFRLFVYAYFLGIDDVYLHPWRVRGGKFDLDDWDDEYWARLRAVVAYAQGKDIIVEVSLFAEGAARMDSLQPSAWRSSDNVQNFGAWTGGDFLPQFYDLEYRSNGRSLQAEQKKFIDKVVAELAPYANVYYEIMNEFPGKADTVALLDRVAPWQREMVRHLRSRTPKPIGVHAHGHAFKRPVSDFAAASAHFWDMQALDAINYHFYKDDPNLISALLHDHQLRGPMLICNEGRMYSRFSDDPPAHVPDPQRLAAETRQAWGHMTAGGYYSVYEDKVRLVGDAGWIEIAQVMQAMRDIVERVPCWQALAPVRDDGREYDDLISGGPAPDGNWQVIAREGVAYLAYFWGAPRSADARIELPPGDYTYAWYDTRRRQPALLEGTVTGGGTRSIAAPAAAAWDGATGIVLTVLADSAPCDFR